EDKSIDIIPEYAGALLAFLNPDTESYTTDDVLAELGEHLPEGFTMLEASSAEDKDALVVTQETAEKFNLVSIGDLKEHAGDMVLGGPPETKDRRAGLTGLKQLYDIDFGSFKSVDL